MRVAVHGQLTAASRHRRGGVEQAAADPNLMMMSAGWVYGDVGGSSPRAPEAYGAPRGLRRRARRRRLVVPPSAAEPTLCPPGRCGGGDPARRAHVDEPVLVLLPSAGCKHPIAFCNDGHAYPTCDC